VLVQQNFNDILRTISHFNLSVDEALDIQPIVAVDRHVQVAEVLVVSSLSPEYWVLSNLDLFALLASLRLFATLVMCN
jgi:hypothetical protein